MNLDDAKEVTLEELAIGKDIDEKEIYKFTVQHITGVYAVDEFEISFMAANFVYDLYCVIGADLLEPSERVNIISHLRGAMSRVPEKEITLYGNWK